MKGDGFAGGSGQGGCYVQAVVSGPRRGSACVQLRDQPWIPAVAEPEEPGWVAWWWPVGLEGRGVMLLSCGAAAAAPSVPGLDADSSCCGSWGLFLTSSMGNRLLGSQCRVSPNVPQQDSGRTVGPCLPWLAFHHGPGCLLPPFSVGGPVHGPLKALGPVAGLGLWT